MGCKGWPEVPATADEVDACAVWVSSDVTTWIDNLCTARMLLVVDRANLALLRGRYSSSSSSLPSPPSPLARFGFRLLEPGIGPLIPIGSSAACRVRLSITTGDSVSVAKVTVDLELVLDSGIDTGGRDTGGSMDAISP